MIRCWANAAAAAAFLLLTGCGGTRTPVDWIASAGQVVTMDPAGSIIANGAIAVRGEQIVAVGTRIEIDAAYAPAARIDRPEAVITPGLINTHTHAPMSLFRGVADDLRLQEWLEKYIFPAEAKNVDPDFVRAGTRLAVAEMLLGGTTTYTDMYYFEELIAEETARAGMRGVLGQTVIGFPVADAPNVGAGLARSEAFLKRFAFHRLITPAVAPHALYTNSDETLRAARALANRYRAPLLIHVSETRKEFDDSKQQRGKTPVAALDALGVFSGRTVAAHGVWLEPADMDVFAARGVGVAHCPSSNMKLASGVAPVLELLQRGIHVGLGPDGPAGSNNDFSMFEEMDLAAKLQKVTTMNPEALPARTAFAMATIGGARVLGLDKEIGTLEPGKRADFITVLLNRPHSVPAFDIYSHLVYALKASDVNDVVINGRIVVRNGHLLTLHREHVIQEAQSYIERIRKSVGKDR